MSWSSSVAGEAPGPGWRLDPEVGLPSFFYVRRLRARCSPREPRSSGVAQVPASASNTAADQAPGSPASRNGEDRISPPDDEPRIPGCGRTRALPAPRVRARSDGVDSGPIPGPFDQVFLGAVREAVAQPFDLGRLLLADYDRLVASAEDLLSPAGQPPDLPRQLRAESAHEARELPGVIDSQQEVQVVRGADKKADPDAIALLGPGKGPKDDLVQPGTGTEQEAAVECPAGHFHQGALFWDEAEVSTHAGIRRKTGSESSSP
jgi:hypothetical protein